MEWSLASVVSCPGISDAFVADFWTVSPLKAIQGDRIRALFASPPQQPPRNPPSRVPQDAPTRASKATTSTTTQKLKSVSLPVIFWKPSLHFTTTSFPIYLIIHIGLDSNRAELRPALTGIGGSHQSRSTKWNTESNFAKACTCRWQHRLYYRNSNRSCGKAVSFWYPTSRYSWLCLAPWANPIWNPRVPEGRRERRGRETAEAALQTSW